ncbi:MAG: radical SAM/Cys-rich domain protein [Magnetococcales bacterium]|nr:radical SAM/Cys-rich domain protein [Magnetococcales bacterium]
MNDFLHCIAHHTGTPQLHGATLHTLQINLGARCNLECHHCHIGASPKRAEMMSSTLIDQLLSQLPAVGWHTVELTGGAPELHPEFQNLVTRLTSLPVFVKVRTNLTLHVQPEYKELAPFLRDRRVGVTGSLPCYLEENVDRQRGTGTYQAAIAALRRLNGLGYGHSTELPLELVYNPGTPTLPPDQKSLEARYRQELHERHGILFTRLIAMANMPIGRFRADLRARGEEKNYHALLQRAFNPHTLEQLMCRHQLSVRWDGRLFDCDFNLALGIPVNTPDPHVQALASTSATRSIATGDHCLACTAGAGSSCSGALLA